MVRISGPKTGPEIRTVKLKNISLWGPKNRPGEVTHVEATQTENPGAGSELRLATRMSRQTAPVLHCETGKRENQHALSGLENETFEALQRAW